MDFQLAPKKKKHITGIVLGPDGAPVEGATVTASYADSVGAVTDARGGFELDAFGGDGLNAYKGEDRGFAMIGDADVPAEQVEIQMVTEAYSDDGDF
jgi:hypothetical protein